MASLSFQSAACGSDGSELFSYRWCIAYVSVALREAICEHVCSGQLPDVARGIDWNDVLSDGGIVPASFDAQRS